MKTMQFTKEGGSGMGKTSRGMGRVELLLLAVMSAYAGSKCM